MARGSHNFRTADLRAGTAQGRAIHDSSDGVKCAMFIAGSGGEGARSDVIIIQSLELERCDHHSVLGAYGRRAE